MTTQEVSTLARSLAAAHPVLDSDAAIDWAIAQLAEDEMDAPSDWDAGTVTFDPYI